MSENPPASFEKFVANLSWRPVCLGGAVSHIQKFCLLNGSSGKVSKLMIFLFHSTEISLLKKLTCSELGTVQFCFFGYLKYTDTFHQLHTKAFAFRIYTRPRDRAQPIGGRRYNYTKTQRTP